MYFDKIYVKKKMIITINWLQIQFIRGWEYLSVLKEEKSIYVA